MKAIRNERGVALVVAMLGLMLMGALVTATFAAGLFESRVAENARRVNQAFAMAELGLSETVGAWNAGAWNDLDVLDSAVVTGAALNGGRYSGYVQRLNQEIFVVEIMGRDPVDGARQQVASFVKLTFPDFNIRGALTTRGPTKVGGSAEIDGNDWTPAGWSTCDAAGDPLAGIVMSDATELEYAGCPDGSCIRGSPPVMEDPVINDETFAQFGDMDWDDLTALATKTLPPGTYTGVAPSYDGAGLCNTSDPKNWGDPLDETSNCGPYRPIIHIQGSATVNGNYGQGILLVDENLSVQGGFQFYGVVIVKGYVKTTGTGGHVNGALMAANVDLDQTTVLGDALVQYSSCAIDMALHASAPGRLLRSRGWVAAY